MLLSPRRMSWSEALSIGHISSLDSALNALAAATVAMLSSELTSKMSAAQCWSSPLSSS